MHKRHFSFLFGIMSYSLFSLSQTPPMDSCAVSLRLNSQVYWICDGGLISSDLKTNEHRSVPKDSLKLPLAHLSINREDFSEIKVLSKIVSRIPVDSCPVGFSHGAVKYYKCAGGLFRTDGKKNYEINRDEWESAVTKLKEDFKEVFKGCL